MSVQQPSRGYSNPPPNLTQPNQNERAPEPSLKTMPSLLHQNDQRHDTQQYDRRIYQQSSTYPYQHPLWQSEQSPDAPPQHIYHPPQTKDIRNQAIPYLVTSSGMVAPVSQQVPLAQRRQKRKITQRKEESGKEEAVSSPVALPDLILKKEEDTEHGYQGTTPSTVHSEPSSRRTSTTQSSKALPISGLLSAEPRYQSVDDIQSTSSTNPSSPVLPPPPKYTIRMRQQPMAARACGFGERDRRVIDPPPILQMHVESPTSTQEELGAMIRNNYCVVHCTLWDPATDQEDTAMPGNNDKRQQRRLMGTLVSSPFVGLDEHSVEGCFFTFPDLSVRTPGTYALKFSLVVLDPMNMRPGGSAPIQSSAMSSPFQVWNAKDFCGMRASTALTKRLKQQGCLISVKKGNAKTNGSGGAEDDDIEDEDDEDDGDGSSKRKKAKK